LASGPSEWIIRILALFFLIFIYLFHVHRSLYKTGHNIGILALSIGELFQYIKLLPIAFSWVDNQIDELEMKTSVICNDFNNIL
jgi:hypothetical protein